MGFMAAAIPLVAGVLGSMGEEEQQQQGPAIPPPPTLGEMFAANAQNYAPRDFAMPNVNPFQNNSPVGGGAK
jgi:hypothetical protein